MKIKRKKKILICSNYAWTVKNFRLPLIKFLKTKGYEIHVLTQFDGQEESLATESETVSNLFISRKGINPFIDIFTFLNFIQCIRKLKPDMVLLFTIKPVIYGSLACFFLRIPVIPMITGLGTVFIQNNLITKIVKFLYKLSLKRVNSVIFQNNDDKDLFLSERLVIKGKEQLVPGSGIDLKEFYYQPLPKDLVFLLIARLISDKGIYEYIEAAKSVKKLHPEVTFRLIGPSGVQNRTAISDLEIQEWEEEGSVEYIGEVEDVRLFISTSTCLVLPSYREGTSRVLLEGASMGRPLIASNVTGCKEIIDNGVTGFLCAVKDAGNLKEKIMKMIELSHSERELMGLKGREKVQREYDQTIVFDTYHDLILKNLK